MRRTKLYYNRTDILNDENTKQCSLSARGFLREIEAYACACEDPGYLTLNGRAMSETEIANVVGCTIDLAGECLKELIDKGVMALTKSGIYIIKMVVAGAARSTKAAANAKKRFHKNQVVLLDKSVQKRCAKRAVKNNEKSVCYGRTTLPSTKKEKRTKKEKNNKYIYIFGEKIFINDRGDSKAGNGEFYKPENFTVYRREYETLRRIFPAFTVDRLDQLLDAHSDWLGGRPDIPPSAWLGPFLSGARALHERESGEVHPSRTNSANQNNTQTPASKEAA